MRNIWSVKMEMEKIWDMYFLDEENLLLLGVEGLSCMGFLGYFV